MKERWKAEPEVKEQTRAVRTYSVMQEHTLNLLPGCELRVSGSRQ
jgi:hypothetical protein